MECVLIKNSLFVSILLLSLHKRILRCKKTKEKHVVLPDDCRESMFIVESNVWRGEFFFWNRISSFHQTFDKIIYNKPVARELKKWPAVAADDLYMMNQGCKGKH